MASYLYIDPLTKNSYFSPFSKGQGPVPALNAGDTVAFVLLFLTPGDPGPKNDTPWRLIDYGSGAAITVRLRNSAGIYASSTSWTRAAATTGVTVTTIQDGDEPLYKDEIQRYTYGSPPAAGRFKLTFPFYDGHFGWAPEGTTASISILSSGEDISAAIEAVKWTKYAGGGSVTRQPIVANQLSSYATQIDYGQRGNRLPLTVDTSDLSYDVHWDGTLALTNPSFNDLFDINNGPAYLEVLVTPAGGAQFVALQQIVQQQGIIGSPGDDTGGAGNSTTADWLDGDYTKPTQHGAITHSNPLPQDRTCFIYRQTFHQLAAHWTPLPVGSVMPEHTNAFLIEETERQDIGGGLYEWDRLWATIPGHRVEKVTAVKTYKRLLKQWTGSILSAASVVSRSQTVSADAIYDYNRDRTVLGLEAVPDVAINQVGIFQWIDTFGGFPFNSALNSPPDTNEAYGPIGGTVELWKGDIYVRRLLRA